MKTLSKKIMSLVLVLTMVFSLSATAFAAEASLTPNNFETEEARTLELSSKLSSYFNVDAPGNIIFTATKSELLNLGVSEQDATTMLSFTSAELNEFAKQIDASLKVSPPNDRPIIEPRGFVGLYLELGPKIRSIAAVPAGAFAAGFVGWHLKALAAQGPWGAGAVAAISASIGGVVGWGVKNHMKKVLVGVNVPGVSWSATVPIP